MLDANQLDLESAPRYRKKATVLAFRLDAGATYDKRGSWGAYQEFPGPHYTIVGSIRYEPERVGGRVIGTTDVYGCAEDEFRAMYEPTGALGEYRKTETIRAIRMEAPFTVDTTRRGGSREVVGASGEAGDWVALQPGGERQLIKAEYFDELYEPVREPGA